MPRSIFVTATDTEAGKTWVTSHLLRVLLAQGESAQALKPIASGVLPSGINEDVQILMAVSGQPLSAVNFQTFQSPVAPALAAMREKRIWQPKQLLTWIQQRETQASITLIEGVGGLMAPLLCHDAQNWLVRDWLAAMPHAEVMLVVPLRLGCISQTLVHCDALASMGRAPRWIVLNDMTQAEDAEATLQMIRQSLLGNTDLLASCQKSAREKKKRGFPFSYKSNACAIDLAARPWVARKRHMKSAHPLSTEGDMPKLVWVRQPSDVANILC